jgi:hypothetical protein
VGGWLDQQLKIDAILLEPMRLEQFRPSGMQATRPGRYRRGGLMISIRPLSIPPLTTIPLILKRAGKQGLSSSSSI